MDKIAEIADRIATYYFQQKERSSISSKPEKTFSLASLREGVALSIIIIKKLSAEILKYNQKNKALYEKMQYLSTLTPPLGAAVTLGTALILKNQGVALASGPFLIGAGPIVSVIMHLWHQKETQKMLQKIDGYLLETLVAYSIHKKILFTKDELNQILETWNFLRRPSFAALIKRIEIYNHLSLTNPALSVLIISSFILLEKSGMSEKQEILKIGIEKILFLMKKDNNKCFRFFTITTLNLLHQSAVGRTNVQKALLSHPALTAEEKEEIFQKPSLFQKQLQNIRIGKGTKNLLLDYYKTVLSCQNKLKST